MCMLSTADYSKTLDIYLTETIIGLLANKQL